MKIKDKKGIRVRMYGVAVFFLFGLGILLARAYQLQVLERDRLAAIARQGFRDAIKLPSKRGTIFDREGHELAISVEVGSIYAHPNLIKDKIDTSRKLARSLKVGQKEILSLLESKRPFVWIERKLPPKKLREVEALGLKGVEFTTETGRYYPGRDIAAHLLGFTGADNQGLEGLERKYDRILMGPQQTLIQMRDALGRPFFISSPAPSEYVMHDLILTIDKDIQYRVQQALESAARKAEAASAQCLIMNPETGEILAMAVYPSFNPNIFQKYPPDQWRNHVVTDLYEPGSTIKAFLLAAALEENVVSPATKFYCEQGLYQVANHVIHDTHKYGVLSVSDIVILSSNIGAVKIGSELGYSKFSEYLRSFGFGSKTGIDLMGERDGFIKPPQTTRPVDRATSFFGQGISVTSLQLASAMAAIANGGKLMRPYIVKAVVDQDGRTVKKTRPQMVRKVLSPSVAKKVAQILEGVVGEHGTGTTAAISGFRVAGKTGTSQKVDPATKRYSKKKYVAVFVGFVPADRPELVILVMIDEPKGKYYGGLVAGPVFQEVGAWTLNNLRIIPQLRLAGMNDETAQDKAGSAVSVLKTEPSPVNEGQLPDFRGQSMREVLKRARSLGLKVALEGTGRAVSQAPDPGASLMDVSMVKIDFMPAMQRAAGNE